MRGVGCWLLDCMWCCCCCSICWCCCIDAMSERGLFGRRMPPSPGGLGARLCECDAGEEKDVGGAEPEEYSDTGKNVSVCVS